MNPRSMKIAMIAAGILAVAVIAINTVHDQNPPSALQIKAAATTGVRRRAAAVGDPSRS